MNRAEFLSLLTRLVRDKQLSEPEAGALLRQFDVNEIDESDLPLPLNEAITPISEVDLKSAMDGLKSFGVKF